MADRVPRCYADLPGGGLCMTVVGTLGVRCPVHAVAHVPPRRLAVIRVVPAENERCTAHTHNRGLCTFRRIAGSNFCTRHARMRAHEEEARRRLEEERLAAERAAAELLLLRDPGAGAAQDEARRIARRLRPPPPDEQRCTGITHHGHRCTRYRRIGMDGLLQNFCRMHEPRELRRAPPVMHPRGTLGWFAQDTQNVHTPETRKMAIKTEIESKTYVYPGDTMAEITKAFQPFGRSVRNVVFDMDRYYKMEYVRARGDFAYKKMLDLVWSKIVVHPERKELEKRLFEECKDAFGMCSEGHMARLANVLQGFDEAAPPPVVSQSEILQMRMPLLLNLAEGERMAAAEALLQEVALPRAEWAPWLEALA